MSLRYFAFYCSPSPLDTWRPLVSRTPRRGWALAVGPFYVRVGPL